MADQITKVTWVCPRVFYNNVIVCEFLLIDLRQASSLEYPGAIYGSEILPKALTETEFLKILKSDDFLCERKFRVLLYSNQAEGQTEHYKQTIQNFENISYVKEIFCLEGGYESFYNAYPFLCQKVNFEDVYPSHILDHLFLSSAVVSKDQKVLKNLKINFILNVTTDLPNEFENSQTFPVTYCQIPILDDQNQPIGHTFDTAFAFLDKAKNTGGNVLVHCAHGRSRSVSIVVAYIMAREGMTCEEALSYVQKGREGAHPNPGS